MATGFIDSIADVRFIPDARVMTDARSSQMRAAPRAVRPCRRRPCPPQTARQERAEAMPGDGRSIHNSGMALIAGDSHTSVCSCVGVGARERPPRLSRGFPAACARHSARRRLQRFRPHRPRLPWRLLGCAAHIGDAQNRPPVCVPLTF